MSDKVIVMHDASVYRDIKKLQKKTRALGLVLVIMCIGTIAKNIRINSATVSEEQRGE